MVLENKLKLTYKFISSLLKNNANGASSLTNIPEFLEGIEPLGAESENTDISSQQQLENFDEISQEVESFEPSPRKLVFQDNEKQYQGFSANLPKIEDPSPRIVTTL